MRVRSPRTRRASSLRTLVRLMWWGMSRPRVRLGIPPHLADLELWGRDVGGDWWALVVWSMQVTPPDGTHPVPTGCAAWVPGLQVEQPLQPVEYLQVRRRLGVSL